MIHNIMEARGIPNDGGLKLYDCMIGDREAKSISYDQNCLSASAVGLFSIGRKIRHPKKSIIAEISEQLSVFCDHPFIYGFAVCRIFLY